MPETKDLLLKKPEFKDWLDMYRNIWSQEESARYMLWNVTRSEADAQERMHRTIAFQAKHHAWLVYDKESGQAIGFGGMMPVSDGIYEDCGIAIGPDFVGRGYGKQILTALVDFAFHELKATKFISTCRSENAPSRGMILSCGFCYTHSEDRIDDRTNKPYVLEFYEICRKPDFYNSNN